MSYTTPTGFPEDKSIKERANPKQCGCKSVLIAWFQSQGSVPDHLSFSHIDLVNRRLNEKRSILKDVKVCGEHKRQIRRKC